VLDTLAAVALSSPSKSDLQQRTFYRRGRRDPRPHQCALEGSGLDSGLPALLVFLGNNRRQRQCTRGGSYLRQRHLDAFFNATVDAAIALEAFVAAAERRPRLLPVSVIRITPRSSGPGLRTMCSGGRSRRRHTATPGLSREAALGLTVHRDATPMRRRKVRAYESAQ